MPIPDQPPIPDEIPDGFLRRHEPAFINREDFELPRITLAEWEEAVSDPVVSKALREAYEEAERMKSAGLIRDAN